MAKVGFIGLGIMGSPMAMNLVKSGHEVVAFSRTPSSVKRLQEHGVQSGSSIADVTRGSDVVITMLPDSPDVESVALGDDGIFTHASKGLLYIDMSTIRPAVAVRVAEHGAAQGVDVLDAPVSGGEAGAQEASLSIMVGGPLAAFERARTYLEAVGRTIVHVGPSGSGQTVKAANQLIVAANIQGLAEAVVFLEAHGVAMESAIEVLGGGLAGSTVLQRKASNMLERSFAPGFRLELFHKDLGIVQSAARDKGVTLLLGSLVTQIVGALVATGDGGLDHSAMLRLVDRLSNSTQVTS